MEPIKKSTQDIQPIAPDSVAAPAAPDNLEDANAMILRMRENIAVLGKRCLSLEQELLEQHELLKQEAKSVSLPVTIYYDTGAGYNEGQKLIQTVAVPEAGPAFLSFSLPEDAIAIRLDPGEIPCIVKDISFANKEIIPVAANGLQLNPNFFLFSREDPNISLTGISEFLSSKTISCSFLYEQLSNKTVCTAFDILKEQLAYLTESHIQERNILTHEIELLRSSSSWRVTRPFRCIKRLFMRLFGRTGKG